MGLGKRFSKFFGISNSKNNQDYNAGSNNQAQRDTHAPRCTSVLSWRDNNNRPGTPSPIPPRYAQIDRPVGIILSNDSRRFLTQISAGSLSQVLIWYVYHDVVPTRDKSQHWFMQLPRELMISWIRLGSELGRGWTDRQIPPLPPALDYVIDELGIDWQLTCQKLIRLSNLDEMDRHEMADIRLRTSAGYRAIAEKLEADKRLVKALRPIRATKSAVWQSEILDWIESHLELAVRPMLDPTINDQRMPESSDRTDQLQTAQSHFEKVCTNRDVGPLDSIYQDALRQAGKRDGLHSVAFICENTPFLSTKHQIQRQVTPTSPWSREGNQLDQRRKSAPALEGNHDFMLSFQESLDALKEEINMMRVACYMERAGRDGEDRIEPSSTERLISNRALKRLLVDHDDLSAKANGYMEERNRGLRKSLEREPARRQALDIAYEDDDSSNSEEEHAPTRSKPKKSQGGSNHHDFTLNRQASRSTPNLVSANERLGSGGPSDDPITRISEMSAEITSQQRWHAHSSARADDELGSVWSHSRENSVQQSDLDDGLHGHVLIPPLQTAAKKDARRRALYIQNPSSTLLPLTTPFQPTVQSIAGQLREASPSLTLRPKQRNDDEDSGLEDLKEYEDYDPFEGFDEAYYHEASQMSAKSVTFSRFSHPTPTSIEIEKTGSERGGSPGVPERSKYRISDLRIPEFKGPKRQKSLKEAGPSTLDKHTKDERHDSRMPGLVNNSTTTEEKRVRISSPVDMGINSERGDMAGNIEEFRRIHSTVAGSNISAQKDRKSRFVEDLE